MAKPLEVVHPHAAGIDIGSKSFYVDAGEDKIRVFPTFTADCTAVRDYLLSMGITTVAMELNVRIPFFATSAFDRLKISNNATTTGTKNT